MNVSGGRKTVFIIGAGAGHDYRMPLGAELQGQIHSTTRVDDNTFEPRLSKPAMKILRRFPRNEWNQLVDAFRTIHRGIFLRRSIDDLLDLHRDDQGIVYAGKLLIAQTILDAERNSNLWFSRENTNTRSDLGQHSKTWLMKLFRQIGKGRTIADFERYLDDITFITFNYDRCLEHFLIHAIYSLFPVTEAAAHEIVYRADIIHPYGVVGKLPADLRASGVRFGDDEAPTLRDVASGLNTYTEQLADKAMVEDIHQKVTDARTLVFLGMHFHEPNMNVLRPPHGTHANDIFATAMSRSEEDRALIRASLMDMVHGDSVIHNGHSDRLRISDRYTCSSLFDEHERALQI